MEVDILQKLLQGKWSKERNNCLTILENPDLHYTAGLPYHQHRERVLQQVKLLSQTGVISKAFPEQYGGENNFGGHIAAFEELFTADPSLQIKAGVQYGLFTAAIQHLGTTKHHEKYLQKAINLDMLGCYGMTESGHGSDVYNLRTTATYDKNTDEFIINTPDRQAWKDYLGNAAKHGRWAVIFAQLYTQEEKQGVHAFLVPIRDENGNFLPNIGGEDDGVKGGLNGIDNGRLHFNNVRIPRDNLLNRYGDVNSQGEYTSPISNPKRRFFIMLGTLVQGRVSLDGAAVVASKMALQIAVTYANNRKQFTKNNGEEVILMDYQTHQQRLLPLIAETYAAAFAHEKLLQNFDIVFKKLETSEGNEVEGMQDLETEAAALKAVNTWHALNTLQQTREACGGNGFLQENRIVQLKSDFDVYVTFEGDNTVLLQLVGKRLLTDFGKKLEHASLGEKIQITTKDTVDRTRFKFSKLEHSHTIHELLKSRVDIMTAHIAHNIYVARKNNLNIDDIFSNNQIDVVELGKAWADLYRFEAFLEVLKTLPRNEQWVPLNNLKKLYGINAIKKHLEWYLSEGLLTGHQAKELENMLKTFYTILRPYAQTFVDAFGYKKEHLRAKIIENL